MSREFTALCVDINSIEAKQFITVLEPEISFSTYDHTKSLIKAVQSHEEQQYDICLITEHFQEAELLEFKRDIKNLNRDMTCVFVLIKEEIEPGFDRFGLKELGIDFVISKEGTDHDKSGLEIVIADKLKDDEIKSRVSNIDKAMKFVLKEVDIAAENFRRGRTEKFQLSSPAMNFIEKQAEYAEEVLERYYNALAHQTQDSAPSTADELDVPEKILKRDLPHLDKRGYTGASHRVWEKLKKIHGRKA